MTVPTRILWFAFALLASGLGVFYLDAADHLFPVLGGDGASHIAPILNYKAGHGLGSVVWALTRDYDPTGQHRFLQYPPLFHLVVAGLIRHASLLDVYLCLAVFTVLGLGIYVALILQRSVVAGVWRQPRWIVLASLSLGAVSTWFYQLPSSGRAEALATPLLLLAAFTVPRLSVRWQPVAAGVFIGLLGATQTAVACLLGLLYSLYVSVPRADGAVTLRRWLGPVAFAGGVSVAVFAACLLLSPYPLPATLRGIAFHLSQLPMVNASIVSYYIFPTISATFCGLFFVVLLAHYLWWNARRLGWLGAANLAAFVIVAWALAVHHPTHNYNLLPFTPVFVALALGLVARLEAPDDRTEPPVTPWQKGAIYTVYFGIFALMSVGFLRQVALYEVYVKHGVSYATAKRAFEAQIPPGDQTPVLFDGAVFGLLDQYDHAYQRTGENLALDPVPGPIKPDLLIHQWYGRFVSPPKIPGYRLVWHDFVEQPSPRMFGLKVGTAMPGYAFALYQPLSP